jgi:hypothetical protein
LNIYGTNNIFNPKIYYLFQPTHKTLLPFPTNTTNIITFPFTHQLYKYQTYNFISHLTHLLILMRPDGYRGGHSLLVGSHLSHMFWDSGVPPNRWSELQFGFEQTLPEIPKDMSAYHIVSTPLTLNPNELRNLKKVLTPTLKHNWTHHSKGHV